MKLFLLLFLLFSTNAFSCVKFKNMDYCVGDKAVAGLSDGTIVGVSANKISIDFTGGSTKKAGVLTFDIKEVYLAKGCLDDICVGGLAVGDNSSGEIVGINPAKDLIAINHKKVNDVYSDIKTHTLKDVAVGNGCIEAYCVGDSAVFKTADGAIVGVNTRTRAVAIRFAGGTTKHAGIGTYDIKTVSIGKGCFGGFCVGDKAVIGSTDGVVIGVNPYREQVSVSGNKMVVTDYVKNTTMRSARDAADPKRVIKTLSDFNSSLGR